MKKDCQTCGKSFEARKDTAKYCSDNCRQIAHRQRHGIQSPFAKDKPTPLGGGVQIPNTDYADLEIQLLNLEKYLKELRVWKNEKITERAKIVYSSPETVAMFAGALIGGGTAAMISSENKGLSTFLGAIVGSGAGYLLAHKTHSKTIQKKFREISILTNGINQAVEYEKQTQHEIEIIKIKLSSTPKTIESRPIHKEFVEKKEISGLTLMPLTNVTQKKVGVTVTKKMSNDYDNQSIVNSMDISKMEFQSLNFQNNALMHSLFGSPSENFYALIYGLPGQGKSTLAFKIAEYLSNNHGRTLYVSREEGISLSVKEKVNQTAAKSEYLDFGDLKTIDEVSKAVERTKYRFVIIDSITTMLLRPEDVVKLRERHKRIGVIVVSQATKSGDAKGSNEWSHDVDVSIKVDEGKAESVKNRFSAKKEVVKLF